MITIRRLAAAQYKGLKQIELQFPERGSFLIEGRNEAGKSTLFDAVHFGLYGVPLVGDLADAIQYGADEAVVQLSLEVGTARLEVHRSVRQTARTIRAEAALTVTRGEDAEVVKGARPVTLRLQQELGGLTAEALLNSCLVAQKQLGRLETLGRSSREDALTILLNLGKLSDVYSRLRIRPEDEEQLRRARARVELARVSGNLRRLQEERAGLERSRRLVELRDGVGHLAELEGARQSAQSESESQAERLETVRRQLSAIDAVKARLAEWRRVADLAERSRTAEDDLRTLHQQIEVVGHAEAELPAARAALGAAQAARSQAQALLDARTRRQLLAQRSNQVEQRLRQRAEERERCHRLEEELTRLRKQHKDLHAQVQQLARLTTELEASRARQTRLAQLQRQLAALQDRRAGLEALEQQAERVAGLLTRWIEAHRAEETARHARRLLDDLFLGVAGVEHIAIDGARQAPRAKATERDGGLRLKLLVDHPLTGALALQLRLWAGGAELAEVRAATAKEVERLSSSSGATLSGAGVEEQESARLALEDALREIGEEVPRDAGDAERRLAQGTAAERLARGRNELDFLGRRCLEEAASLHLAPALMTVDALPEAITDALQRENDRRAELSASDARREGLQGQLSLLERSGKERRTELDECQLSLSRDSDEDLHAERERLDVEAAAIAGDMDQLHAEIAAYLGAEIAALEREGADGEVLPGQVRDVVQRKVDALAGEAAVLERRVEEREALVTRAAGVQQALDGWRAQLTEVLGRLDPAPESEASRPEQDAVAVLVHAEEQAHALEREVEGLHEAELRGEEQSLQRASGAAEATLRRITQDSSSLAERIVQLAQELGAAMTRPEATQATDEAAKTAALVRAVEAALPEVAGDLPPRDEIEQRLSALDQERGDLERGARDARTMLGDEPALALEEAEGALEALQVDMHARRRGQEIVAGTRQRMINKVLPDTIQNMCLLLPMLTAERYRYAELTPEYRLQVWDERRRGFVEKGLFSGGTQDQFSLALRLGFALAALPRELGTSPGFLFLDEPLSSFDRDRTEALVNLLTHGQIATFFQQVFLISHSQAFDPGLFSHHIVMEHGEVVESTLPAASVSA